MRIIPVIDVKAGQVVHAVRGERSAYRPLVSRLTRSTQPLDVARAFRDHSGLNELYVADIDAIGGSEPAWELFAALHRDGFQQMADVGVADLARPRRLKQAGVQSVVVGLETLPGPALLADILGEFQADNVIFSLDLRAGVPIAIHRHWTCQDAPSIVAEVRALGVERTIILDLARVGVGHGTGTEHLCRSLRQAYADLELIAGGGIAGIEDVKKLAAAGVNGVLVASALHDGRLGRGDIQ